MARRKYSFYIDDTQAVALRAIKVRDGMLESEQIRRALDAWIFDRDVYDAVGPRATKAAYDLVNHEAPAPPARRRRRRP